MKIKSVGPLSWSHTFSIQNQILLFINSVFFTQSACISTAFVFHYSTHRLEETKSTWPTNHFFFLLQKTEKHTRVLNQALQSSHMEIFRNVEKMYETTANSIRTVAFLIEFLTEPRFVLRRKIVLGSLFYFSMRKVTLCKRIVTCYWKGQSISLSQYLQA